MNDTSNQNKIPRFPKKGTLKFETLKLLATGKHVSVDDLLERNDTHRLPASICYLRKNAWPISDEWHARLSEAGMKRVVRYKKYFITPNKLEELFTQLGDRLKNFIASE